MNRRGFISALTIMAAGAVIVGTIWLLVALFGVWGVVLTLGIFFLLAWRDLSR